MYHTSSIHCHSLHKYGKVDKEDLHVGSGGNMKWETKMDMGGGVKKILRAQGLYIQEGEKA